MDRLTRDYAIAPAERRGLSRIEAAQYIGISEPTFDRLVEEGHMPKPKRIFTRLVWDRLAIDEAFSRFDGTSAPAAVDEYAV